MGSAERRNPFNTWKREATPSPRDVFDRYGRLIQPGDAVMLLMPQDTVWRVASVKEVSDPRMPPGTVELTFTAVFTTGVQGGVPITDLLKVADVTEFTGPQGPMPGVESAQGVVSADTPEEYVQDKPRIVLP
jgi:hypothetical protein